MIAQPAAIDPRAFVVVVNEAARRVRVRTEARQTEDDWRAWLGTLFPGYVAGGFAPYHAEFWDWVWGLRYGERARPFVGIWPRGFGKALAVDTPIPTPDGWTAMGDLRPGDTVFDHRGEPTRIVGVSGVEMQPCYRLVFADGTSIVASEAHRWLVLDRAARQTLANLDDTDWATESWEQRRVRACEVVGCTGVVRKGTLCSAHAERHRRGLSLADPPLVGRRNRGAARYAARHATTADLAREALLHVRAEWAEHVFAIPVARPLQCDDRALLIAPYLLGVWLGDGHSTGPRVTAGGQDRENLVTLLQESHPSLKVFDRPNGVADIALPGLKPLLRELNVLENKHIPPAYLRAGVEQRRDLLRGLLDTDGCVAPGGRSAEFASTREALARGCAELARSLGYRAVVAETRATLYGKDCGPSWRVTLTGLDAGAFGLPRKADLLRQRSRRAQRWTGRMHYLETVEPSIVQPVQCITVESPSGMFLAGEQMIPTHNSTNAELACAAVAARGTRRYALFVCETQEQADDHVANVAGMLESARFGLAYPDAASRRLSKYGHSRGWRRNRLRTSAGFTLDAIGLDTAARGVKLDEDRPDLLVFDDLDGKLDSAATTERKSTTLTHTLLPAGSDALAVLAIQNLVLRDGIFARLADGRADFMADRIVSGPHPAVRGLTTEQRDGRTVVTGGEPTWPAMGLAVAQHQIDEMGITAYLAEKQHDVEAPDGGMFGHLTFRHCRWEELPDLVRIVVWVDPAVTATDASDAHGIQADGLGPDGTIYRLWSWEDRTSPEDALRRAILKGVELKAEAVGVETDQGGDTWRATYEAVVRDLVDEGKITRRQAPRFDQAKAGSGHGPKVHRAGHVLADYERGQIVHVVGTHETLERALRRFPKTKPLDLVDAGYYSWLDLRGGKPPVVAGGGVAGGTFFGAGGETASLGGGWDA